MNLDVFNTLKEKADKRLEDFEIIEASDNLIDNIQDEAYIRKPTWIGGDKEYVALFIDLNGSTELSTKKRKSTMAKIYDYFTQSAIDFVCQNGYANYVDIKGDGIFAIFEGDKSIERAFIAGISFKTFFNKIIVPKMEQSFDVKLSCKMGIYKDKILVRRLGNNYFKNEVWAGRLINIISKLVSYPKSSFTSKTYMVISNDIYDYLSNNYHEETIITCGCKDGKIGDKKEDIWKQYFLSDPFKKENDLGEKIKSVYVMNNDWCNNHGQVYINNILNS